MQAHVELGKDVQDVYSLLEDGESFGENEREEICDFKKLKLMGIDLSKLCLKGGDFQNADLRHANLAGAILEDADMRGANLRGARLTGATLLRANFENAKLDNANLVRADLKEACFKNASLTYSSLRAAEVAKADFSGADLQGVNMSGAKKCLEATFDNADLQGARMDFTGLDKLELKGVKTDGDTQGLRMKVFNFFKTSWVEFLPGWFGWLLAPFRFIKWIVVGIFRLLTLPFRLLHWGEKSSS